MKDSPKDRGLTVTYAILLGEKGRVEEAEKVLRDLLKGGDDDEEFISISRKSRSAAAVMPTPRNPR